MRSWESNYSAEILCLPFPQTLLGDKPWHMQASNALTGEGIDEGVEWLAAQLLRGGLKN